MASTLPFLSSLILIGHSALIPLHRYYNNITKDHFYSGSSLTSGNYISEGIECWISDVGFTANAAPWYQYYSDAVNDHFYTFDCCNFENVGYSYQNIAGYLWKTQKNCSSATGLSASMCTRLYRLYSSELNDHLYTISTDTFASYTLESEQYFCVSPSAFDQRMPNATIYTDASIANATCAEDPFITIRNVSMSECGYLCRNTEDAVDSKCRLYLYSPDDSICSLFESLSKCNIDYDDSTNNVIGYNILRSKCVDYPFDWKDAQNETCSAYSSHVDWCADDYILSNFTDDKYGYTANDACCACDGGIQLFDDALFSIDNEWIDDEDILCEWTETEYTLQLDANENYRKWDIFTLYSLCNQLENQNCGYLLDHDAIFDGYEHSLFVCQNQTNGDFIVNLEINSINFTHNLYVNALWFDLDLSYFLNSSSSNLNIEIVNASQCMRNDTNNGVNYGIFPCQILDSVSRTSTLSPNNGEINQESEDLTWIIGVVFAVLFVLFCVWRINKDKQRKQEEAMRQQMEKEKRELELANMKSDKENFKFFSNFDEMGILYALGSDFGMNKFQNPAITGKVFVDSPFKLGKDSKPLTAVTDRALVRCMLENKADAWFYVDFEPSHLKICPNYYTLRHYASWNTEALRSWNFEGSNGGNDWKIIKQHTNDDLMKAKGSFGSWAVECSEHFSQFRIKMTGKNSNDHNYLCCSGFEIYGHVQYENSNSFHMMNEHRYEEGVIEDIYHEGIVAIEMTPTKTFDGILKEGDYFFRAVHSNKVIDIDHKSHYNKVGASLVQMDAAEDMFGYGNNQTFYVQPHESKYYTIQCKNSCLYWNVSGSKLIQANMSRAKNQQFEFVHCEKDKYLIKVRHSNKYISMNGLKSNGAKVVQSDHKQEFVCSKLRI